MYEPQTGAEEPGHEGQIPAAGEPEQEQPTGVTAKLDEEASRAHAAVTGAKDTVVDAVTTQGEQATEKVKGGAQTIGNTAKDHIYLVAVACLALGFVLGLLVRRDRS